MRVVIADDSVLFREGIAQLLERAGFEIAGQSGTADDLLLKVRSYTPDVAIVDIRMPPTNTDEGLQAAREIRQRHPDVSEFADAVRRVAEGGSAFDAAVVSRLVGRRRGEDPLDTLTHREQEVLELMAQGRSNQAIAEQLVVTAGAVEKHVRSIFGKLRLPVSPDDHRRVLAVLTYLN